MQAIVLAAGYGSRLQQRGPSKPLVEIAGKPLLRHVIERLHVAGCDDVVIVLGHRADAVEDAAKRWGLPSDLSFVRVADPSEPNGVSVLAAAPLLQDRALLVMSDHLVDAALYACLAKETPAPGTLLLGVDRRLDHVWVDMDDVTRVKTDGQAITHIGKGIADYNGFDTGVFSIDHGLIEVLASLDKPSLSQGVAMLSKKGRVLAVETGDANWIDVDDPRAAAIAERWLEEE